MTDVFRTQLLLTGEAAARPAGLVAALQKAGFRVDEVPPGGDPKAAVEGEAPDAVLINPAWVDPDAFPEFTQIRVHPDEPFAANALMIGDAVIYPEAFPYTAAQLDAAGIRIVAVDVSELAKAEGAVTCCSLILNS